MNIDSIESAGTLFRNEELGHLSICRPNVTMILMIKLKWQVEKPQHARRKWIFTEIMFLLDNIKMKEKNVRKNTNIK